jgi:hypothetical protein
MSSIDEDIQSSANWIAHALTSSGYHADFSQQSLWEIDRFFDEHTQGGEAIAGGLLSRDLGQRIFAIGSYMGEVIRRALGAEWVGDDNDPQEKINIQLQLVGGAICWPVQRAMKRFKNGPEDGIAAWGLGLGLNLGPKPESPSKSWFRRFFG